MRTNIFDAIKQIGYPVGANVRITPANFFDEQTLSATPGENRYFTSASLSTFTRNKKFPLSGNEIAFIDQINVRLMGTAALSLTTANMNLFNKTCLQIKVDGRERLKVPLVEVLSAHVAEVVGTTTTQNIITLKQRTKKLRLPLIFNSHSDVEVKIITDGDYSALGAIRIELNGVLYNKLVPFDFDPVKSRGIERINYTIFDTVAVPTAASQLNLFQSADKAQNLFSKIFPLASTESFEIENIEISFPVSVGTAAAGFETIEALARETVFKMQINNVDFLELADKDLCTVLFQNSVAGTFKHSDGTITTNFTTNKIEYGGLTLPVPVTIPAKANIKATLDVNTITNISATPYINVMLKGVLQRIVQ